ncbi:tetratricopeptide repeat protein [Novipirellula artificiosorum]|uniref:Malonyl-[acyl-carrier protein] O-methyltransferase n=1 Tax=Novipirellula artificiosorum TaxID=2528016 RepID=A0A5C6E0K8_9BACT|nr:tetratricopeptide repeat protein [Novipirellula artificiosorum]TWU42448.1 Malonyl-[acyl-carrier protein] O-methyltransferase [Novipirellula artificiosorum]
MNVQESANACLKANDLATARHHCTEWIRVDPANAKPWHLLGVCHARDGELDDAIDCFQKATDLDHEKSLYPYNLAVAYKALHKLDQAIQFYRQALERRGDFFEARNNLGASLVEAGRSKEALECFERLVKLFPESADANFNLANTLNEAGRIDEAATHYRQAVELDPEHSAARENLGRAFLDAERFDEARQVWTNWLSHDPTNATARHMLASLSDDTPPSRCDDQCIRETFDEKFATNFDQQLTRLEYCSPELIADTLQQFDPPIADAEILDAGCGTGLCAPRVRSLARNLIGVDLSGPMLAEARERGLYDQLKENEITQYMSSQTSCFDVVISADTLCYFGDLQEVLGAVSHCLKPNGVVVFTVESLESTMPMPLDVGNRYRLRPHGRYAHSESYLRQVVPDAGLSLTKIRDVVPRKERGRPVQGWLVTAQKKNLR